MKSASENQSFPLPDPASFEDVACLYCGSEARRAFVTAQEDLTGKPGDFSFVQCKDCSLVYQHPRIDLEHIKAYYDDEYIAHRKQSNWGPLAWFFEWAMDGLDRKKDAIVRRHVALGPRSEVLDVGCGVGTFLSKLRKRYGCQNTGVDFIDLRGAPELEHVDFHCGPFYEQDLGEARFDLITMWHFLEHDYDPLRSLRQAHHNLKDGGRLVVEVPRLDSVSWRLYQERWPGLQAPQHTVAYDKAMLLETAKKAGFPVVEYLPYGAYPAYFYLFAGAAFKLRKGRGLDASKAIYPYFAGQFALAPVILLEKKLNLAMQTIICSKGPVD